MGLLLLVALLALPVGRPAADGPESVPIAVVADGTLTVGGDSEIPPYLGAGRWTEGTRQSSSQHVVRHFRFLGPGGPPAIELYVARDLTGEAPDGVFEIGLVRGFLSGFGSQSGFTPAPLVVDEMLLAGARVNRARATLSRGERTVWLYAYIFPRQLSLIFLTLRPRPDAAAEIEGYLATVRLH